MNQTEAQKKAEELWGDQAFADMVASAHFIVGEKNGRFTQVYGHGRNWEKAFENANLRLN